MFDLAAIQQALREYQFDAWLLYDFRGSNPLAQRVLHFPPGSMGSRRWAYCIPAQGAPRRLVHRIESAALDHLPGSKRVYLTWQEFRAGLAELVAGCRTVALEYSPRNDIPYISRVDAGTVELLRESVANVVSSGDLVQLFEAAWTDEQWRQHQRAAVHTNSAYERVWKFVARQVRERGETHELEVQAEIMRHFAENGLTTYHPPIVGVGPHSGDPHYEPQPGEAGKIRAGDFLLVDLWAKLDEPHAVYSDLTRVGYVGESTPEKYERVFQIVAAARDAAIARVRMAYANNERLCGWQVDGACREVIVRAGYGPQFCHRTGHSIGQEVHGNGANMDNLETHEERCVLPRTCFSIEPGIYQNEFGVRSEINVFIDAERRVHVTGGELQTRVVPILTFAS